MLEGAVHEKVKDGVVADAVFLSAGFHTATLRYLFAPVKVSIQCPKMTVTIVGNMFYRRYANIEDITDIAS